MRGAGARLKRERLERMHQAWVAARLMRAEKMPTLSALLEDRAQPRSPDEVRASLRGIAANLPKISMAEWRRRRGGG